MRGTRAKVVIIGVTAAVLGYAGAAAYTAMAVPSVSRVTDWGPGDGLTRYVLTAASGNADPQLLAGLRAVPGVVNAQRLSTGQALVATKGLVPADLSQVRGVTSVEVSPTASVLGSVSDPYWPYYGWNLDNTGSNAYQQATTVADADTDAPDAWPGGTGTGMVVAVVDTGYFSSHPDLAGALWTNPHEPCGSVDTDGNGLVGDCHGWNFTTNSADVDNGSGGAHGTGVAGVIAARAGNGLGSAGVAPGVSIMPLVIGSGGNVDVNLGAEAIRYAVDHGADVINASWGGATTGSALANLESAVAYANAHDVLVVAAAGNDNANRDTTPMYPASLTDPNIVTVGASDADDRISGFSAYGATSVDLFAPGTGVFSTSNTGGYSIVDGTSIAAPQVAGVVALYRAAMPGATAAQLKQALLDGVDPVPAFAGRSVSGGRLSAGKVGSSAAAGVRYSFASMNTAVAGPVSPAVSVTAPTQAGAYTARIGLGMEAAGEIWALSGKPVTMNGATVTTDDTGTALFTLGSRTTADGLVLQPSATLGDGRYVLTVQLYVDSASLGRTYAAPMLVGSAVASAPSDPAAAGSPGTSPGSGAPGGPGSSTPPGSTPPGSAPGTPGNGGLTDPGTTAPGSTPGSTTPGSTPGSTPGTTPGSTTPGSTPGTTPGTAPGTTPGSTTPGTAPGSTPGTTPGTTPGSTTPGSTTPGTTPGSTTPGTAPGSTPGTTPGSTTPGTAPGTTPGTGTGSSGGTGATTYPQTGAFQVTGMSPTRVNATGGTLVTITALALPANPIVRVGASAAATVVSASTTRLTFTAPARVAGVYDVTIFAPDGTATVLTGSLTYVDAGGSGAPGTPSTGGAPAADPAAGAGGPSGSAGGTGTGGTGTGGGSAGSGGSGGSATPGTGSSSPGSGGSGTPVVRFGPSGERLVRSASFSRLVSIWTMSCSSSCGGVAN